MMNFLKSSTHELANGMASAPLGDRVERLLTRGRQFARGASAASLIVIAGALAGMVTLGSNSPQWVAFAQDVPVAPTKPPAPPVAPRPAVPARPPAAPRAAVAPAPPEPPRLPDFYETERALEGMLRMEAEIRAQEEAIRAQQIQLENQKVELAARRAEMQRMAGLAGAQRDRAVLENEIAALRRQLEILTQRAQEQDSNRR